MPVLVAAVAAQAANHVAAATDEEDEPEHGHDHERLDPDAPLATGPKRRHADEPEPDREER